MTLYSYNISQKRGCGLLRGKLYYIMHDQHMSVFQPRSQYKSLATSSHFIINRSGKNTNPSVPAKMCDVASPVANGSDKPTNTSENGKHCIQFDSAVTTILSFCKRYYDVAIVCVVMVAVWALFSLPTIFFHLPMKVTIAKFLLACNRELLAINHFKMCMF